MKSILAASGAVSLLSIVAALPAAADNPLRILPANWEFTIKSLKGPGCPDFGVPDTKERTTRLTYGANTVDGSEIYYWFIAYPHLRVSIGGEQTSWCETELAYQEYKSYPAKEKGDDYRLRLHKNGTRVIATYDLQAQTKATFKFTYETTDDDIKDTVFLQGPATSGQYQQELSSYVSNHTTIAPVPDCGSATIKFRTELTIGGFNGTAGRVDSEHSTDATGKEQYYGIQQGFSYDWEKC